MGGINFERECDILQYIRRKYYRDKVELRLDANGAFKEDDATYKLKELSRFDIHSIEQPIKPRSDYMAELIKVSSIPIALDEELIGVFGQEEKGKLLDDLKPPYIILKPTILGGFNETKEWADLANKRNIGWWLTSALESNVGLNAIAQFAVGLGIQMPQGLGTGMIYSDNFQSPLHLKEGKLAYNARLPWEIDFTKFFS